MRERKREWSLTCIKVPGQHRTFDVSVQRHCAAPAAQPVERATLHVITSVSVKLFLPAILSNKATKKITVNKINDL